MSDMVNFWVDDYNLAVIRNFETVYIGDFITVVNTLVNSVTCRGKLFGIGR